MKGSHNDGIAITGLRIRTRNVGDSVAGFQPGRVQHPAPFETQLSPCKEVGFTGR